MLDKTKPTSHEEGAAPDQEPLHEAQSPGIGATVGQSVFNMAKLFLGISILATPNAFSHAGLAAGIVGIFCVSGLCIYTIHLQATCRNEIGNHIKSYSELGYAVYGKPGKTAVDIYLLVAQMGIGIAYLIFNGK